MFDFEDLENTEAMLVLCVRKAPGEEFREEDACYVWSGPDFDPSDFPESAELDENHFVQKCIDIYWGEDSSVDRNQIRILNEHPDQPSDAFQYFFD